MSIEPREPITCERRALNGRRFVTIGSFSEYPSDPEMAFITSVLWSIAEAHASPSLRSAAARIFVSSKRERGVGESNDSLSYRIGIAGLGGTIDFVPAANESELASAVARGWRAARNVVLVAEDARAIDVAELVSLEGTDELPSERLMHSLRFAAVRWFHATSIDLHSSVFEVPAIVDMVIASARALGLDIKQETEHF